MARRGRTTEPGSDREVFTTGEVARLCHVTIRTVIRWFESGELKGYKIPGSRDRRIPRENLIEFMQRHELPLGELAEEERRPRLLIVDDEPEIVSLLKRFFESFDSLDIATATNGYEAGAQTVSFQPDVLLIDYNLGDITGLDVVRTVRTNPDLAETKIVCMSGFLDATEAASILTQGVDDFIKKPLDLEDLRERVFRLIGVVQS